MRTRRGFTLMEVLLAMLIVVILTTTMAVTIKYCFALKNETEHVVDMIRDSATVGEIWVNDLRNTLPPNPNSSADPNAITTSTSTPATGTVTGGVNAGIPLYLFGAFYGDTENITFYTSGPEPKDPLQADARYVEFGLSQQQDGTMALVRRVNTNILSDSSQADPRSELREEVLVTNVQSVKFQYFDQTNVVSDIWDSTDTVLTPNVLPYAVSMELTLNPTRDGEPPRIITRYAALMCAAPPVTTDTTTTSTTGTIGGE